MARKYKDFKDTQFFDWDSEPSLERESTSFQADEFAPVERSSPRRNGGGLSTVVLACGLAIGAGLVVLATVPALLQRLGS
jgi:hypothetical protein